ncbi:MAG: hypothetical protein L6R42_009902, partial [Xanthoria sp. 1 TBL-2021]
MSLLIPPTLGAASPWFEQQQQEHHLDSEAGSCDRLNSSERQIDKFHYWRERLVLLKRTYDDAEPKNLSQLWWDDRKKTQWFTFWVAVLVFIMTVFFGVIQVNGKGCIAIAKLKEAPINARQIRTELKPCIARSRAPAQGDVFTWSRYSDLRLNLQSHKRFYMGIIRSRKIFRLKSSSKFQCHSYPPDNTLSELALDVADLLRRYRDQLFVGMGKIPIDTCHAGYGPTDISPSIILTTMNGRQADTLTKLLNNLVIKKFPTVKLVSTRDGIALVQEKGMGIR